jgi:hypothetical protein
MNRAMRTELGCPRRYLPFGRPCGGIAKKSLLLPIIHLPDELYIVLIERRLDGLLEIAIFGARHLGGNAQREAPRHVRRGSLKNYPAAGDGFLSSCDRPGLTRLGFWPFFGANCASRFSARCRGNAYGNRDAGKFTADATQLPTGCQPESLAKPARRRSHKATRGSCLLAASSTAALARPRHSIPCRRYRDTTMVLTRRVREECPEFGCFGSVLLCRNI